MPAVFPTLQKHTSRKTYTPFLHFHEGVSQNGILRFLGGPTYNRATSTVGGTRLDREESQ